MTMKWNTVERLDADAIFGVKGTPTLNQVARTYVEWVVEQNRGNKVHAATALGVSRKSLYKMIERWQWADMETVKAEKLGTPMGTLTISDADAKVVAKTLGLTATRVQALHTRKREKKEESKNKASKDYRAMREMDVDEMSPEEAAG